MNKFKLLESLDSGSNYNFGEKMNQPKNPKSLFDLSHLVTTTIPKAGRVFPISMFQTIPGDDHDINVDCLLRVLPSVVPLYSRQRLYIYGFYSRYSDLWNNWQVFMDKGYTGNVTKLIPTINSNNIYANDQTNTIIADSLGDCFGFPIGSNIYDLINANISALPFMMYLRIYRDYFMNKNEFINDRVMLPDDDSRFRLDDDGHLLSAKDQNIIFTFNPSNATITGSNPIDVNNMFDLKINENNYIFGGFYHEYPNDYFTSALPFTQRGNVPTLNYEVDLSQIGLDFEDTFSYDEAISGGAAVGIRDHHNQLYGGHLTEGQGSIYLSANNGYTDQIKNALEQGKLTGSNIGLAITLEDIRKLAIEQTELEILARTDGSYSQFGLSFFGEASKAAHDYRPTYIGGCYKNIVFTEVLQTSGSSVGTTDPSSTSPLGAYSGHGITGITNGRIGHIHCDDYGLIMILGCIMPDVYYSQGLEKIWTNSLQAEMYLPQRSKLGMQPILNKEIFYAGNNGSASGEDNYVWAYQNAFDHLRYMPNRIKGKIADPNNNSFYPYTQSRKFTQLPNWGRDFSEATDIRHDYLFAPSEDAYTAQFSMNIRSVREMPYKSVPASII